MSSTATLEPAAPTCPYTVRELVLNGDGLKRLVKVYPGSTVTPFLTDEEADVMKYVIHLEGELARMTAMLVSAEPEPAADAAAAMAQGAAEGVADAAKGGGKWKKPK